MKLTFTFNSHQLCPTHQAMHVEENKMSKLSSLSFLCLPLALLACGDDDEDDGVAPRPGGSRVGDGGVDGVCSVIRSRCAVS